MMIFNYKYPEGREYADRTVFDKNAPVKTRFLTAEERKAYGCDDRVVVKKRCRQCGEVKSDYHFLPGKGSEDGLSPRCRKCTLADRNPDTFLYDEGAAPVLISHLHCRLYRGGIDGGEVIAWERSE